MKIAIILFASVLAQADYINGWPTQQLAIPGVQEKITVQTSSEQVHIADVPKLLHASGIIENVNKYPNFPSRLCQSVDSGSLFRIPIKFYPFVFPLEPNVVENAVGKKLRNAPKFLNFYKGSIVLHSDATSAKPEMISKQGDISKISEELQTSIFNQVNAVKGTTNPTLDLTNYNALACDLIYGRAEFVFTSRMLVPNESRSYQELISASNLRDMYSAVASNDLIGTDSFERGISFGINLRKASSRLGISAKLRNLRQEFFEKLINAFFDSERGEIKNLDSRSLDEVANALRTEDHEQWIKYVEMHEVGNVQE